MIQGSETLKARAIRDELAQVVAMALAECVGREPADPVAHLAAGLLLATWTVALPPMERACVLLKDVFDYSLQETAEVVDSTVGGVKSAHNKGRTKLARTPHTIRRQTRPGPNVRNCSGSTWSDTIVRIECLSHVIVHSQCVVRQQLVGPQLIALPAKLRGGQERFLQTYVAGTKIAIKPTCDSNCSRT